MSKIFRKDPIFQRWRSAFFIGANSWKNSCKTTQCFCTTGLVSFAQLRWIGWPQITRHRARLTAVKTGRNECFSKCVQKGNWTKTLECIIYGPNFQVFCYFYKWVISNLTISDFFPLKRTLWTTRSKYVRSFILWPSL